MRIGDWTAGFYPGANPIGGEGMVVVPDHHAGVGTCKDVMLRPCSFDFEKVRAAVKDFAKRPFGVYVYGAKDCRAWVASAISWGTLKGAGCTVP